PPRRSREFMSPNTPLGLASRRCAVALSLILVTAGSARADQHALLIGVGSYKDGHIPKLTGPANDILNVRQLLVRESNCPEATVPVPPDRRATPKAIRAAFGALARACKPGDPVVFLFAGHGLQLPGDEIRDKAASKALCPADTVPHADGRNADNT